MDDFLIADATDFVDSVDIFGCVDFWGGNISILHTTSPKGTWFIASAGDLDDFTIGGNFSTEDNVTGEIIRHTVLDKIQVVDSVVTSIMGNHIMVPDSVATFK